MAHLTPDKSQVKARIVYWGIAGAGVSSNLRVIYNKLRADHRGDLRSVPTRIDPTTSYEVLPIELGQVNGLRTQLQIIAVPGGPEHAPTRKQLLDQVDGVVFVVDSRSDQIEANLESLVELREDLEAYGRELDDLPVVVQYNKRDASDPYTIEELHRQFDLPHAAVFEAVSSSGKGVLQTLTTISKRVVRVLRDSELEARKEQSTALAPEAASTLEPEIEAEAMSAAPEIASDVSMMEAAILAEGDVPDETSDDSAVAVELLNQQLDDPWPGSSPEEKNARGARIGADFEIVSAGQARLAGARSVELPLVLGNPEGETVTLRLTVSLAPLLDGEE